MYFMLIVVGLAALVAGAELLVRSSSRLATAIGVSPLVVGLTVVAFGTSAPELVISVHSTLSDQPDVALGNVIGSNIFNVLFILGISALIVPLIVAQKLIRFDVPLMVGLSLLLWLLAFDGCLGRFDGILLVCGLLAYTSGAIYFSRKEQSEIQAEYRQGFGAPEQPATGGRTLLHFIWLMAGLVLLVFGSRWFVGGVTDLTRLFGVSELVIGLTIVAAGTSLPEVATSIMAVIRGERDIAVGNVVGSNIFNILGVLGVTSAVSPAGVLVSETALRFDFPVMLAVAIACLPVFFTGHVIARWEGGLFLGYYVAYATCLAMSATVSAAHNIFNAGMLGFVLPLTVVTLGIGFLRSIRDARQPQHPVCDPERETIRGGGQQF